MPLIRPKRSQLFTWEKFIPTLRSVAGGTAVIDPDTGIITLGGSVTSILVDGIEPGYSYRLIGELQRTAQGAVWLYTRLTIAGVAQVGANYYADGWSNSTSTSLSSADAPSGTAWYTIVIDAGLPNRQEADYFHLGDALQSLLFAKGVGQYGNYSTQMHGVMNLPVAATGLMWYPDSGAINGKMRLLRRMDF